MTAVLVNAPHMLLTFEPGLAPFMAVRRWSRSAFTRHVGGEKAFLKMRGTGEVGAVDHLTYERSEPLVRLGRDPIGREYAAIGTVVVASLGGVDKLVDGRLGV